MIFQKERESKILRKGFESLRFAKNLQKASKFATMWNRDFLKRAFFNALLN